MVNTKFLAGLAALTLSSSAFHVDFTRFNDAACPAKNQIGKDNLREGPCKTFDKSAKPFTAFNVTGDDDMDDLEEKDCKITVYNQQKCAGEAVDHFDLKKMMGEPCINAQVRGRSVRITCIGTDDKPEDEDEYSTATMHYKETTTEGGTVSTTATTKDKKASETTSSESGIFHSHVLHWLTKVIPVPTEAAECRFARAHKEEKLETVSSELDTTTSKTHSKHHKNHFGSATETHILTVHPVESFVTTSTTTQTFTRAGGDMVSTFVVLQNTAAGTTTTSLIGAETAKPQRVCRGKHGCYKDCQVKNADGTTEWKLIAGEDKCESLGMSESKNKGKSEGKVSEGKVSEGKTKQRCKAGKDAEGKDGEMC